MLDANMIVADECMQKFLRSRGAEVNSGLLADAWTVVKEALLGLGTTDTARATDSDLLSRVIVAISALTEGRRRIDTMILIPVYDPMRRPEWMSEEIYHDAVRRALWSRLEDLMENRARQELQGERGISNDVWMWLGGWVRDLCDELVPALKVPVSLHQSVRNALFQTVFAVCGHAAAGRADRVAQFRPLLAEMKRGFLLIGDQSMFPDGVLLFDTRKPSQPAR